MGDEHPLHGAERYVVHLQSGAEPSEAYAAVYEYTAFFSSDK